MKNVILIILLCPVSHCLLSQTLLNTKGSLIGKVIDEKGKAVEFASVALLNKTDSTIVKGSIADSSGVFQFDSIIKGSYYLQITAVGFDFFYGESFTIDSSAQEYSRIIKLKESSKVLDMVVVRGQRAVFERQLGKLIVNVNSGAFKTAKNAIDVLGKSPSITIGRNGELTVKGQFSPTIFIDDKKSSLDELKTITPEEIDQIEIIANPSAKYDGESRAVINIKLKRDKTLGVKGTIYSGLTYNKFFGYESGFTIQYKTKKTSYFGKYEYFNEPYFKDISILRKGKENNVTENIINQQIGTKNIPSGSLGRIGLDYFINSKHTVGVLVRMSNYETIGTNNTSTQLLDNNKNSLYSNTFVNFKNPINNISSNINYVIKIDSLGSNITTNIDLASFSDRQSQNFVNNFQKAINGAYLDKYTIRNDSQNDIILQSVKIDYTKQFRSKIKLETGLKSSFVRNMSSLLLDSLKNDKWINDDLRSNSFDYKENISGFYAIINKEFKKDFFQFGMRIENTITKGSSQKSKDEIDRKYINFLPSFQFQHSFNDQSSLNVGYSRKISRPSFQDLNPFKYYIDPYTYTVGNPLLFPTVGDQLDISYNYKNFSSSIFYRYDKNFISQLPFQSISPNSLQYILINVDKRQGIGSDFNLSFKVLDWWQTQNYLAVNYNRFVSSLNDNIFDNSVWSYSFQTTNLFKLKNIGNLEFSFNYLSPNIENLYSIRSMSNFSIGFQRPILSGKIDLKCNVSDIFYTFIQRQSINSENLEINYEQKQNSRAAYIRFTYKFGKSTFSGRNRQSANDEENRVKR